MPTHNPATHTDQRVRCPSDSVGLARACAVLNQVRLPCPLDTHGSDHLGHALPLMEAREDQAFLEIGYTEKHRRSGRSTVMRR